jgi:hypothetical protein
MKPINEFRKHFELLNYNCAIRREDFEYFFRKTNEKVTFTFAGWDGKSYDGESRTAKVYRTTIKGFEDIRFIKVGKAVHYIFEDWLIEEKATGVKHPMASWVFDVLRKEH